MTAVLPARDAPTDPSRIPAHNSEKTIGEALDSVWAQTFDDLEVIVADDCSTDADVRDPRGASCTGASACCPIPAT